MTQANRINARGCSACPVVIRVKSMRDGSVSLYFVNLVHSPACVQATTSGIPSAKPSKKSALASRSRKRSVSSSDDGERPLLHPTKKQRFMGLDKPECLTDCEEGADSSTDNSECASVSYVTWDEEEFIYAGDDDDSEYLPTPENASRASDSAEERGNGDLETEAEDVQAAFHYEMHDGSDKAQSPHSARGFEESVKNTQKMADPEEASAEAEVQESTAGVDVQESIAGVQGQESNDRTETPEAGVWPSEDSQTVISEDILSSPQICVGGTWELALSWREWIKEEEEEEVDELASSDDEELPTIESLIQGSRTQR